MPEDASTSSFGVPPFAAVELLDGLLEGVVVHAPNGRIVYANPAAQRLLRIGQAQLLTSEATVADWHLLDVFGRRLQQEEFPAWRILAGEDRLNGLVIGLAAGAGVTPIWLMVGGFACCLGSERFAVISFVDTRTPLGFSFRDLVEMSADAVLVTDAELAHGGPFIVYANHSFENLCGYPIEQLLGRPPSFLQGPDTSAEGRQQIRNALEDRRPIRCDLLNYHRSGEPYWVEIQIAPVRDLDGMVSHFVAIQRNVTAKHDVTQRLLHEATHDALTGLLNRRGFAERAELLLAQAQRLGAQVALLLLDIDYFKEVNDSEGHEAGDRLLRALANCLEGRLRGSDLAARIGGDEFVVLLTLGGEAEAEADAERVAEELRASAANAFYTLAVPSGTGVSIGVAPACADTPLAVLLSRADQALYAAKHAGRNRVCRCAGDGPAPTD